MPGVARLFGMLERAVGINAACTAKLARTLADRRRIVVLTGAGISAEAGIPDYRDADGAWKRRAPVQFREFMTSASVRRRYWARSLVGWPAFAAARPAAGHAALAALERTGALQCTITQNVDDLHRRAGSRRVVDLHGRLARVRCMKCRRRSARATLQAVLAARNPAFIAREAALAPDGDADLEAVEFAAFRVPRCRHCGGILKPDVTFYGETIPSVRNRAADAAIAAADALIVVGSSLMVFSAYRLVRRAAHRGIPVLAVNLGRTRADALIDMKVTARAGVVLPALAALLNAA